MSIRTEEAYLRWITQFVKFHKDKTGDWVHPKDLGNQAKSQARTFSRKYGKSRQPPREVHQLVHLAPKKSVSWFAVLHFGDSPLSKDSSNNTSSATPICTVART